MRTLLILRGAPGAGKSTWVKEHHLEQYTLCPDDLRVLCSSIDMKADGTFSIGRNREVETEVWKLLFEMLDYRMSKGEFTVIDATASKTKDIQQYKDLAEQYRYNVFCVDFTGVPLDECLKRNKMRPEYKWVPDDSIENIYARFATQKVPGSIKVIKPDGLDAVLEKSFDLSQYKKIVFVGSLRGCYDTAMQYFKNGLADDTEYIFLGDYVDRGNQNAEVVRWLISIMNKPNVCLLEGNHDVSIRDFGNSAKAASLEFEQKTKPQLVAGGISEKDARMLYRKCRQMSHFTYNGLEILACHGGIPSMKDNLVYLPTKDFINGVGDVKDSQTIAEVWMRDSKDNQFQVHAHRNVFDDPTQIADRVFNLEGGVEFGGKLRLVELTADLKWTVVELDDCQPVTESEDTTQRKVDTVEDAIAYLRNNDCVQEKHLDADVSSFNFTRDAFWQGNWNKQTILARGLFVDVTNKKIMARSYEKFFRIDETAETKLCALRTKLKFPVTAYVKENGFLAIVSYDYRNDSLFIASKSTTGGDFAGYIRAQLEPYYANLLKYLRYYHESGSDLSLVFECEDIEHDPHIIKYAKNNIVLLDGIYNKLEYCTVPYSDLKDFADNKIGCSVKEKAFEIKDWDQFLGIYSEMQSEDYKYEGRYIEGFVFVDSDGFMTKCKTGYYNQWKKLRSVADQTLRCGYYAKTGALQNSLENAFYGFCRKLYDKDRNKETKEYPYKTDIISLRDRFLGGER